jgi:uncharacterized membrane protein YtjA (UPF0391 family)
LASNQQTPSIPCWFGHTPVAIEHVAAGVIEGKMDVHGLTFPPQERPLRNLIAQSATRGWCNAGTKANFCPQTPFGMGTAVTDHHCTESPQSDSKPLLSKETIMLYWAAVFLIIALIAGIFGFGGVMAGAAGIAKVLFFIFLVLFVISLIMGRRPIA